MPVPKPVPVRWVVLVLAAAAAAVVLPALWLGPEAVVNATNRPVVGILLAVGTLVLHAGLLIALVRWMRREDRWRRWGLRLALGMCLWLVLVSGAHLYLGLLPPERAFQQGEALVRVHLVGAGLRFIERAAEANHLDAAVRLGETYRHGDVRDAAGALVGWVPADGARSEQWFARARALAQERSAAGDGAAQLIAGTLWLTGSGGPTDADAAARYFRMAAEQGVPTAELLLGQALFFGQRYEEAHTHLWRAARDGSATAYGLLHAACLAAGDEPDLQCAFDVYHAWAATGDPDGVRQYEHQRRALQEQAAAGDPSAVALLAAVDATHGPL